MRFLGGPISREESDRQALGANVSLRSAGFGKIAIERTSDAAFVGMCGLSREHWFPDDLELGWRLLPQYVGHGYATEAGKAWLDYAFAVLKAARVISIADLPNRRSIAVMERLGMGLDHVAELDDNGERFSAVVYSIASSA
jgi:RimJ/RimL family protein N-acetyltransferase